MTSKALANVRFSQIIQSSSGKLKLVQKHLLRVGIKCSQSVLVVFHAAAARYTISNIHIVC